ncbi:SAM-dependent methyltransferase [Actinomadura formosensis]|uniref:SAM-dependent methyltransferase n=1 Tax=Actinomadura formosensis TaxID=60706 RepID=UPI0008319E84|nr:SAM-dependent methyltransferase [Actinomadura formosensis]
MTDHSAGNTPQDGPSDRIRSDRPHSARVWGYLLGGKENYPADRQVGDMIQEMFPDIALLARVQRYFLARAVRFLAGEAGIRQFLDIGAGLPTVDNTHEVAQRVAPESRIVYVDNDPLVLVHAQALLTSTPEGACDYIDADVRDPELILRKAAKALDFTRPIALTLLGIMGQIPDSDDPWGIVEHLLDALPAGSYLALSDGTNTNATLNHAIETYNANSASSYHLRSPDQIARFFDRLEPVEPGVVPTSMWRPDLPDIGDTPANVDSMCGVGHKPA